MVGLLPVANVLGRLLSIFSSAYLMPIAAAIYYNDGTTAEFVAAMAISLLGGLTLYFTTRADYRELKPRDGFLLVSTVWVLMAGIASIPLLLVYDTMSVTDAFFEAMSALTTTGATVMTDLDNAPPAINLWRHELNWLGGMGIIVLAVALLPMLGVGGMQLYKAETPGPMKDEKLTPRITETAKNLWYIYVILNVLCTLAFWAAGMNFFDALCHSFATLALGGYSTHDASIGYFNSPAIELVAGVFSIVAAVNFALFFLAWRARSLRAVFQDAEFRFCMAVFGGIIATTCGYLYFSGKFPAWEAFHRGFFQAASVITDNGLGTIGYPADWPIFVPLLLMLGSFFGGCVGSTCGGIKAIRFLLLYKQSVREARLLIRPAAQIAVKVGQNPISDRVMQAVWAFYYLYIFSYCFFSLALTATGVDLVTSFGSVAGCLNNMGIGLGETAVGFAPLNDTATWLLSLAMLVGRFEVFPLLLLFLPDFWK